MDQYREGQKLQGSDGNIYVVVNGVPTLAAAPMPAMPMAIPLPVNPVRAAREAQDAAREDRRDTRAENNDAQSAANEARRIALAEQAEARQAAKDAREASKGEGADSAANAKAKVRAAQAIQRQLGQMRQIYDRSFKGTGPIQSVREMLPSADAERMKALARTMRADLKPLIRGPGEGTFTEGDQALLDQLIPDPQAFDAYNEQLFTELETRVNDTLQQFGGAAGTEQKADNEVPGQPTEANDKPPPPGMIDSSQGTLAPITGDTKRVPDEKANSKINAFINAGAWTLANQELQRLGRAPITPAERKGIEEWKRNYPNQRYNASDIADVQPVNMAQQVLNSPTLAPVAAGLASYADAATAGTAGALAGDEGQGQLAAAAAMNPTASGFGSLAGAVTGALGAEAAIGGKLAAMGVQKAAQYAPRIGDAAFGAATGFNGAQDGEGLQGALLGGAVGFGGGVVGRNALRAAGGLARGVQNPGAGYLQSQGIPTTVGSILGGNAQKMEDALTSVPFLGGVVENRQREGFEALAERMAGDAVAPIGGVAPAGTYGQPLVDDLLQQGSDAYGQATAGVRVPLDPQFSADMAGARGLGQALPSDFQARFDRALENRVAPIAQAGELTGDTFQQSMRGLKGYRAQAAKAAPGFEDDYRTALTGGMDALRGQMMRGGGQSVVEQLGQADEAWKRIKVIQKAVEAARNGSRSGEVGLPSPSQFNDAAYSAANKFGGPRFNGQLLDAAQQALPSKLADSGTTARALVAGGTLGVPTAVGGGAGGSEGGLAGAGVGAGVGGLGTMLMLAAGGSKFGQKLLVDALTKRPGAFRVAGDRLLQSAGAGGAIGSGFGSSVLTPLLVGP